MSSEYNANQIQVLEGLEAVRKRPGMYIGSTSAKGLHHLVYEIVDNSVDEALAGFCNEITVKIHPDNSISVMDNGRGIPVDINDQKGMSALQMVFTILHAGGKFGGGGYKVSGGLHGVGASVVNALSEWLVVQVHRDGKIHEQKYTRGDVAEPLTVVGETEITGTYVHFLPDDTIFEETVFDYDVLKQRFRETARSLNRAFSRRVRSISTRSKRASARWRSSTRASASRCATSAPRSRSRLTITMRAASRNSYIF